MSEPVVDAAWRALDALASTSHDGRRYYDAAVCLRAVEQHIAALEAALVRAEAGRTSTADLIVALRQAIAAIQRDDVETPVDEWVSALRRAQAYFVDTPTA